MIGKFFKTMAAGMLVLALAASALVAGNAPGSDKNTKGLKKNTAFVDFNYLDVNNILIYFENTGNIQDPTGNWSIEYPKGSGRHPIFAAGFTFSGYIDGDLSTAWMASASRIEEWQPGNILANGTPADPNNPRFKVYKYTKGDAPSANPDIEAWPADLGAPFIKADGTIYENGETETVKYEPGNGDLPFLRGDQMVWYVINDGIIPSQRLSGSKPFGLEAQVNAFSYAVQNELGYVSYIIYKFINKGPQQIDRAIFSVWSDPDLGDSEDDLVGVDSVRSLAFCFNATNNDATYGAAPPASGYDFFLGPQLETGSLNDTVMVLGRPKVGFKQLVMDSFVKYTRGDPTEPDPGTIDEARFYQEGFKFNGSQYNPLTSGAGGLATDNPRIVFPGYPELGTGWRDVDGGDKRMMINTKEFSIAPGDTQVIVVGYMVGQGSDNFQSVAEIRKVDDFAQKVFDANFLVAGPPPAPKAPIARIDEDGGINITFKTKESFSDVQTDDLNNKKVFKGYNIYQYASSSQSAVVDGVNNKKLLLSIAVDDGYSQIYKVSADGQTQNKIYEVKSKFENPSDYVNDESYFSFNIPVDAFTNFPFIDGETYYFGVSSFNLETNYLVELKNKDGKVIGHTGPDPIGESTENIFSVPYRTTVSEPYVIGASQSSSYVTKVQGDGDGPVLVDVVMQGNVVSGKAYTVEFFYPAKDTLAYRIKDKTSGTTRVDTLTQFSTGLINPLVDGLSIRVGEPSVKATSVNVGTATWVSNNAYRTNSGADYTIPTSAANRGGFIKDDPLTAEIDNQILSTVPSGQARELEIEFTTTDSSLAYRYIAGVRPPLPTVPWAQPIMPKAIGGTFNSATDSIVWAGFLATHSSNVPNAGRLRAVHGPGKGVIKVPFKVYDKSYEIATGTKRQLAIAFVESYVAAGTHNVTFLNSKWDSDATARETFLISAEDYNPNLAMPADSNSIDSYMNILVKAGTFNNPWMFAWEPSGDITQLADGQKVSIKTSAFTPTDKFEISGFTSAAQFYEDNKKDAFGKLTIYPNPYMGDNPQELSANTRFVSILGMPKRATVRIYNLAGELVRKIEKDDASALMRWDLKNTTGLNVASGVYLINIDAPGVGNKTLKFALIQRQERIEIF